MAVSTTTDRGTVLVFMPAAVLILMILGALAVDFTAVHLRQRELENAADAAANDAAAAAVDSPGLRDDGEVLIDRQLAASVIVASVGARNLDDATIDGANIVDNEITVSLSMHVEYIFARAFGLDGIDLQATGSAQLE
ncbi:MAG: pilus assembly protein TadG-related protein [Acidimicrobiales bacterium]